MNCLDYTQAEIMIIDWINTLDIPSCTLVDDLNDLKSGCVVADIVSWIKDHPVKGIYRNIQTKDQALSNWSIILKELTSLLPSSIITDAEEIFEVNCN